VSIAVTVCGATGRVGRTLLELCSSDERFHLRCAITSKDNNYVGADTQSLGGPVGVSLEGGLDDIELQGTDVCLDFSSPEASLELAGYCKEMSVPMVIGTTGFNSENRSRLSEYAKSIPIVVSPNMSVGINVCFSLVDAASHVLGDEFDVEILDVHHRHKVDSPSGTALKMGELVANARGSTLTRDAVLSREGTTGARTRSSIGFQAVRGGDIVGEHTVLFAGEGERVEITHRCSSRRNYANGALRAAIWLLGRAPGIYDMQDVLGLR